MKSILPLASLLLLTVSAVAVSPVCQTPVDFNDHVFATICSPATDAVVDERFHFSGAVSSPFGLAHLVLLVDGHVRISKKLNVEPGLVPVQFDVEHNLYLPEGQHSITLEAIDDAGQTAINTEYITVQ